MAMSVPPSSKSISMVSVSKLPVPITEATNCAKVEVISAPSPSLSKSLSMNGAELTGNPLFSIQIRF